MRWCTFNDSIWIKSCSGFKRTATGWASRFAYDGTLKAFLAKCVPAGFCDDGILHEIETNHTFELFRWRVEEDLWFFIDAWTSSLHYILMLEMEEREELPHCAPPPRVVPRVLFPPKSFTFLFCLNGQPWKARQNKAPFLTCENDVGPCELNNNNPYHLYAPSFCRIFTKISTE